ncbi:2-C-methyl-D-erythritol 2,4-cyclodiphosphate synthase [Rhodohalobacter sp. SW132]|uniref:2-C-methyl-D-erythritol 2,4-cyclodiphosphate synthase n=1 Tax=Rhodohalobacter sp. SW132 TaxID=2293433 RepID=UPI000E282B8C|nr:2-C-methyl-D-erythritol 2,4-cyclodiphosphate synthase [Rhodohalobacter sp. SW132]
MRVGLGYDSHIFASGRKLILGGIDIPYTAGLKGHSDADVLLHSLTDAILGAASLGDIGSHFPDTDPEFKNADSGELLKDVMRLVRKKGYEFGNGDAVIVAEEPKMKAYIAEIEANISRLIGCENEDISVKATTNEKMGAIGRKEGIAVHSVVLLMKV